MASKGKERSTERREPVFDVEPDQAPTSAPAVESPAPRVFLADTSPARQAAAEDIKNWLLQHQVLVLRAAPWDGDWEAESRELIGRADLFVDLHEGAPHAPAVAQAQIAKALGKQRVRWLPRGELAADAAQALMGETRVIEETLEDFKEALNRLLAQPGERHKPRAGPEDSADARARELVLLVAAQKDEACLAPIEQKLDEIGCGRDAFVSEDVIRRELSGNICRCTGYHNIVKAVQAGAAAM